MLQSGKETKKGSIDPLLYFQCVGRLLIVFLNSFYAQANTPLTVNFKNLDPDHLTLSQLITYPFDSLLGNLGDMNQTVTTWENVDESTEVHDLDDPVFRTDHVARLEVAVDHTQGLALIVEEAVGVAQPSTNLDGCVEGACSVESLTSH